MPVLLTPIITTALAGIGITGTVAKIAGALLLAGLSLGLQAGTTALQRQQAKKAARRSASNGDFQQTIRGSVSARTRHYGEVKVSGTIVFIENIGTDVFMVVAVGTGTIDSYVQFYIGEKAVLTDADGAVTNAPFWIAASGDPNARSHVRIQSRRGYAAQDPFSLLTSYFPAAYTTNHKLNGIAAVCVRYKAASAANFSKVYNNSIPDVKAVIHGAPVYDPRISGHDEADPDTWAYSRNSALIYWDYLVNADGMRVARSAIDVASFTQAANDCDEFVALREGGSERRYRCSGSYSFDETPADVAQRILDTCRGEAFLTREGKIGLRVGKWIEPEVTITEDDIIQLKLTRGVGLLREFNAARPIFTSPEHGYQDVEAAEVINQASVDILARKMVQDVRLPMVSSHSQAQRLAKAELYEDNPEHSGEMQCHYSALNLIGQRVFRLQVDHAGRAIDLVCRVTGLRIASDLGSLQVTFEEMPPEAYEWDEEVDEGDPPVIPPETSDDPTAPAAPTGFSVTTETNGTTVTGVRWDATERAGQVYDFRWRESGGDWTVISGLTERAYVISPTVNGDDYEAEARIRTAQGGISLWAGTSFTATAIGAGAPAAPTGLTATGGQETIEILATQSTSVFAYWLQWAVYPDGGSPSWDNGNKRVVQPGDPFRILISAAPANYDVSVRALSVNLGEISTEAGPASATVTGGDTSSPSGSGGDAGGGGSGSTGDTGGSSSGGPDAGGLY